MDKGFLSCCYFPTRIVLLDDDEHFLKSIGLKLGREIDYLAYSNPSEALRFLNEHRPDPFTNRCLLRPEELTRDHRNIDIDVRAIRQEIYNPKRFEEIYVLVVDYAMPGMNGLELCKQLNDRSLKVILLTGEADTTIATQAFNKGIIHKYIRKDEENFAKLLSDAIHELQRQRFEELSEIIIDSLTNNSEYPPSCLDDPVFVQFFNDLIKKHHVAEYYLLDASGSFLFLNKQGSVSWLAVKDEDAMNADVFDAEICDEKVDDKIIDSLKTREKVLFLYSDEDFRQFPTQWRAYMHPAKQLSGRSIYYYSYIENSNIYHIDVKRMLSYSNYLDHK